MPAASVTGSSESVRRDLADALQLDDDVVWQAVKRVRAGGAGLTECQSGVN